MIPVTIFAGCDVAVVGAGLSGLATARALDAGGANVVVWDDKASARDEVAAAGLTVADLEDADFAGFAALVLAPGIPLTHPEPHWSVLKARAAGVEVIGDVELFFRERTKNGTGSKVIVITGTNGKSTTTALTAHLLSAAGKRVALGGNIGKAVLDLEPFAPDLTYVLELSSFQIDLTPSLTPDAAALLNITPDHLDRHGTIDNYAAIKARLPAGSQGAVVSIDDTYCQTIADDLTKTGGGPEKIMRLSTRQDADAEVGVAGTRVTVRGNEIVDLSGIGSLRGTHNAENACAAAAALMLLPEPLSADEIARGMKTFPGLAHRMEQLGRQGSTLFVNDSKATNADSAEKALTSFPKDIYWILGGKPKTGGIADLKPHFSRVAKAYLIGEATEDFASTLDGKISFECCGTLENAVAAAARDASASGAKEPVVLLSPACASFDQYRNFEVRGDAFRDLVAALPGFAANGGAKP